MVLDNLGSAMKGVFKKVTDAVFVNDALLDEIIKEIQRALLRADVNVKLVFSLSKKVKERFKEEKTKKLSQKEQLTTILYEELVALFGQEKKGIDIIKGKNTPFTILLVGLYGSGKTTSAGKLANYYSKRGLKVALVGLDVHRPAAAQQLEQVAKKTHVDAFTNNKEKDPLKIWNANKTTLDKYDLIIVDTAGRDALSEDLIEEISKVSTLVNAKEKLLVLSADIGQTAEKQARTFHENCGITGIVITKLDGTAKGGGSLSACAATGAPIKFIGIGEKPEDIETFNPTGFVSRLLGMGDLEALLEKAREVVDESSAEDMSKKFLSGDFNLVDLYEQVQSMKKMGPLKKVMDMIPGMGKMNIPEEMLNVQEEKTTKWKYILNSCTQAELEDPDLMDRERIDRIAKGSGTTVKDVRELLKHYRQSKKMMKMLKGKNPEKLMKKMGGLKF